MLESHPLPSPELVSVTDPVGDGPDVVVAGISSDGQLSPALRGLDPSGIIEGPSGVIESLVRKGQLRGKAGESTLIALPGSPATMLLVVGGCITLIAGWLVVESVLALLRYRRGGRTDGLEIPARPGGGAAAGG